MARAQERLLYLIFWLLWVTSAMLFGLLENSAFGIREIVLLGILALIIAVQWVCYFHTQFVLGIVDGVRKCCACKSGAFISRPRRRECDQCLSMRPIVSSCLQKCAWPIRALHSGRPMSWAWHPLVLPHRLPANFPRL